MKDIVTHVYNYHGDTNLAIVDLEIDAHCVCGCLERANMFYGKPPVPVFSLQHYFEYTRRVHSIKQEARSKLSVLEQ